MATNGRDSISSSANYGSVYDARGYTGPKGEAFDAQKILLSKDSLEGASKVEKEVMDRFHSSTSQLPNEILTIIGRAGKILFMVVALPPYVFLYGIPKWFFQTAMPQVWKLMADGVDRAFQSISALFSQMMANLSQLFKVFKIEKTTINKLTDKNFAFLAFLKKGFERVVEWATYPKTLLSNALDKAKEWTKGLGEGWQRTIDKVKQAIERARESVREKFEAVGRSFEPVVNALSNGMQAVVAPVVNLYQTVQASLANTYTVSKNAGRRFSEAMKRAFALAMAPQRWGKELFVPLMQKVAEGWNWTWQAVANKWNEGYEFLGRMWEAVTTPFLNVAKNVKKRWSLASESVAAAMKRAKQFMAEIFPQLSLFMVQTFPKKLREWLGMREKVKQAQVLQVFRLAFRGFGKLVKEAVVNDVRSIKRGVQNFMRACREGYRRSKQFILDLPGKLKKAFENTIARLTAAAKSTRYWFQWLMAWAKILFKHAMQYVRDTAAYLGNLCYKIARR